MSIRIVTFAAILATSFVLSETTEAGRRVYTWTGLQRPPKAAAKPASTADAEKPFADLVKDRVQIGGLFTFYRDTITGSVYMAIKPEQFDQTYLMSNTVSRGDGTFSSNGAMHESLPFYLKRVGKKVLVMERNVLFRGDTTSAFTRAIASRGVPAGATMPQ